jgi:hypothetical protein
MVKFLHVWDVMLKKVRDFDILCDENKRKKF